MTIKETAGKILLYFYQLQRAAPSSMQYRQLAFVDKPNGKMGMTTDKKWLTKDLLEITRSSSDALNAFMYLRAKRYIDSTERASVGKRIYVGIQLTGNGIDIVESLEHSSGGRQAFSAAFNMDVQSGASIDDLIKQHLGSILDSED